MCARPCPTLCGPMDCLRQAPLSTGFSRQECGRGDHSLLQGGFPTQRLSPRLPHLRRWQAGSAPLCHLGSPKELKTKQNKFAVWASLKRKLVKWRLEDRPSLTSPGHKRLGNSREGGDFLFFHRPEKQCILMRSSDHWLHADRAALLLAWPGQGREAEIPVGLFTVCMKAFESSHAGEQESKNEFSP